jgi:hypothetical protein
MQLFGKIWWVVYVLAIVFLLAGVYATNSETRQITAGSFKMTDSHLFTLSMTLFLWAISISTAQSTGYLSVVDK